jgi:hypothetical protein
VRHRLNYIVAIFFFAIIGLILLSHSREAEARPCMSVGGSSTTDAPGGGFIDHQGPCYREYLTDGPLYNPMFSYSNSSLSFEIPSLMWSAFGKAVFVPSARAKVSPNTTTYWFLRVPRSSAAQQTRGSFVSSTSPFPERNELLGYTVVSSRSGITWVRFPVPAQLHRVLTADARNVSMILIPREFG